MIYQTAVILLAAAASATALTQEGAELVLRNEFSAWKLKYNKTYTAAEEETRFANFIASVERVAELQAHGEATKDTATFGLNKFSDMTPEEFKSTMLTYKPNVSNTADVLPHTPRALRATPTSFDWNAQGKLTPVKNQGQCGSCWAESATSAVESAWAIAGHPLTAFSVQQVVSCDTTDGGCRGGDSPTAYNYIKSAGGLATEASYPYTSGRGITGSCQSYTVAGGKVSGYTYATPGCTGTCTSQNEATLAASVAAVGPPSICVDATNWQDYTSGILTSTSGKGCGSAYRDLDHCVQLTGYHNIDTTSGYWIVRNSWAADWGVNGFIYLAYGKNTCGVADEAINPIVA